MKAAGILMHKKRPTNFAGVEFGDANVAFAKCSLGRRLLRVGGAFRCRLLAVPLIKSIHASSGVN
jgi:hypothetical protein